MKKLIISLILCICVMKPLVIFSYQFEIILKEWAQMQQIKLKDKGYKIIDILPLDNEKHGYVKIIYE